MIKRYFRKSILQTSFAILISLLLIEGLSYFVILIVPYLEGWEIRRTCAIFQEQTEEIERFLDLKTQLRLHFDQILGWRYSANYERHGDIINSQGIRSTNEYSQRPSKDKIRLAAFGDSFVYSNEVPTNDSWSHLLEHRFPNIEVLNFGVGAYGNDQAYLRYKHEGSQFSPEIVIIGFSAVMLRRNVNVYRRFISTRELPLFKPRFILEQNQKLRIIPNPLSSEDDYKQFIVNPQSILKFGKFDYHYEPLIYKNPFYDYSAAIRVFTVCGSRFYKRYLKPDRLLKGSEFNTSSPSFHLLLAILDTFISDAKRVGIKPIVVIFPMKSCLLRAIHGKNVVYRPLTKYLDSREVEYIDLKNAFLSQHPKRNIKKWFMREGHYSRSANEIVAATIARDVLENHSHRN